ncbi:MAG: 2,2-dialkylglycine decarboxylase [Lentisphaerae bacterium ADurb.Bin082]|nr:MAG: 2,2-dialkylglycine decarboxylase [Lentisphaerae bacterium ADurb.Bin082]
MDKLLSQIYGLSPEQLKAYSAHVMLGGGSRGGPILERGKGVRVWDTEGKDYIDCTSQSWALYLGYANDAINAIIHEHIENMTHIHQGFDTKARYYLAHKLASLAPAGMNRVSFTVGGGPAIEAAMKIAFKNIQPSRDFVTLFDSYHGTTLGTMGASWISTKSIGKFFGGSRFLPLTRAFVRIPNPVTYRNPLGVDTETYIDICLTMTREIFQRGTSGKPAGVIVEPIQASAGQLILPTRYLQELRKICDEFETLLIYDEIQTFGRIGDVFAANHFGVAPDIIVLGKGLGAGLPLAAIIISDKLEGFQGDTEELHTFANPSLSMITAAKQLEMFENGVLANCREMGAYLGSQLCALCATYPEVGDVRQLGMHIGVELVDDPESKNPLEKEAGEIRKAGFRHGLILGTGGVRRNVLKIKPPLIINRSECDEILEKFTASLCDVLRK